MRGQTNEVLAVEVSAVKKKAVEVSNILLL